MAGKNDNRDIGQPGSASGMFAILGLLVFAILVFYAVGLSMLLSGAPGAPENALAGPFALLRGTATWTSGATIILICLTLGLLIVVALVVFLVLKIKSRKGKRSWVDKKANFLASRDDIKSMGKQAVAAKARKRGEKTGDFTGITGFRIGREASTGQPLYCGFEDLYLDIWGPRRGKTTSRVVPSVLEAPGWVIATSNKRDLVDVLTAPRSLYGKVWVFDPQRLSPDMVGQQWFYDPLDFIRARDRDQWGGAAAEMADLFIAGSVGTDSKDDGMFKELGKGLLANFFLAATIANRPIVDVFDWAADEEDTTAAAILDQDEMFFRRAGDVEAEIARNPRTRTGVYANVKAWVSILVREDIQPWITARPSAVRFTPDEFVQTKDTLIVQSREGASSAAALSMVLTVAVMDAAQRLADSKYHGRLPVPGLAALDEIANVVPWPDLPSLYSHFGSRGIICITILQSYSQGVEVWGERGMKKLFSASTVFCYGGGVRETETLNELAALIGRHEQVTASVSTDSISRSVSEKDTLTAAELAALPEGRMIVMATGKMPMVAIPEPFFKRSWPPHIQRALDGEPGPSPVQTISR